MSLPDLGKKQHDVLKQIEWMAGINQNRCPICSGSKPNHKDNCHLAELLAAAAATNQQAKPEQRYSEYNVPLCPTCGAKAIHISAISDTGRSRICQCDGTVNEYGQQVQQHTWVVNEQGVEI